MQSLKLSESQSASCPNRLETVALHHDRGHHLEPAPEAVLSRVKPAVWMQSLSARRRLSATVSHFTLKHILIGQHGMVLSLNNTASRGDPHPQRTPRYGLRLRGGKISVIDTNLSDVDMRNAFFV
jgi:hypothetical protein